MEGAWGRHAAGSGQPLGGGRQQDAPGMETLAAAIARGRACHGNTRVGGCPSGTLPPASQLQRHGPALQRLAGAPHQPTCTPGVPATPWEVRPALQEAQSHCARCSLAAQQTGTQPRPPAPPQQSILPDTPHGGTPRAQHQTAAGPRGRLLHKAASPRLGPN